MSFKLAKVMNRSHSTRGITIFIAYVRITVGKRDRGQRRGALLLYRNYKAIAAAGTTSIACTTYEAGRYILWRRVHIVAVGTASVYILLGEIYGERGTLYVHGVQFLRTDQTGIRDTYNILYLVHS